MAERCTLLTRLRAPFWNPDERRLRAVWRLAGFHACLIGAYFPSSWMLKRWAGPGLAGLSWPEKFLILEARQLGLVLLALAFAARVLDRRPWRDFGLRWDGGAWADLSFGLALGGLLISGLFAAERAAGWITVTGTFRSSSTSFARAFAMPVCLFVIVGVQEELYFRGYLLRNLAEGLTCGPVRPRASLVAACVVSSALFGAVHLANPNATIMSGAAVMLAGVMLSLGYVVTGRLALPIGLHVSWDLFEGSVYGFPVSGVSGFDATVIALRQDGPALWTGGGFGPEAGLLGMLAMLAGMLSIATWVRLQRGHVALRVALSSPRRGG